MPKGECSICQLPEVRELVDRLLDEGKFLDDIAAQTNLLLASVAPGRSVHRSSIFRHKGRCYIAALRLRTMKKVRGPGRRRLIIEWTEWLGDGEKPKPTCFADEDTPSRELLPSEITDRDTIICVCFEPSREQKPTAP